MTREEIAKKIVNRRDWAKMVGLGKHPEPGSFVITGRQAGNDRGIINYFGHVVQVRKKAGCFGTDIVLIRHCDGVLIAHENQSYCNVDKDTKELILSLYDDEHLPDKEDQTQPYTIGDKFPETGTVVEPKERQSTHKPDPFMITTVDGDGNKTVTAIID